MKKRQEHPSPEFAPQTLIPSNILEKPKISNVWQIIVLFFGNSPIIPHKLAFGKIFLLLLLCVIAYKTILIKDIPVDKETVLVLLWDEISSHAGALKLFNIRNLDKTCHVQHSYGIVAPCQWVKIPNCEVDCVFTRDRSLHSKAKVVFFHPDRFWRRLASSYDYMPSEPKQPGQLYAVFGHEPAMRKPWFWLSPNFTQMFDISFHWGHNADVPLTFYYFDELHYGKYPHEWWKWANVDKWIEVLPQQVANAKRKGPRVPARDALASVVVSNCDSPARNNFLAEFMTLFPTASFGTCLNNADGDRKHENISRQFENQSMEEKKWYLDLHDFRDNSVPLMEQKIEMISKYPFHFAIESTSRERGFITEKIFQAMLAGTVPLYYGHPEIVKYMPPNSFIWINQFANAAGGASFIKKIAQNITLYMGYHAWRNLPDAHKYFERFVNMSRTTAACRLCKYWKEMHDVLPPGKIRYKKRFGWMRTTPDAPVDMVDRFDPPLDERYVDSEMTQRVGVQELRIYESLQGALSLEDSVTRDSDDDGGEAKPKPQ